MNALLLLLASLAVATPQASPQSGADPRGFDLAQMVCEQSGLTPTTWHDAQRNPRESVVILMGEPSYHESGLRLFLNRGGAALYASDRRSLDSSIFEIRQGPHRVRDESIMYRGHDDCFRVAVEEHEITQNVNEIIVNRAGGIRETFGNNWKRIASLPESSHDLLAAYEKNDGRLVLLSDDSVFTNEMLMKGDNPILAVNILNWLTKDNRKQLVFIVDGQEIKASNLPPMLPPDQPIDPSLIPPIDPDDIPEDTKKAFFNRLLREVQKNNEPNSLLNKFQGQMVDHLLAPDRYHPKKKSYLAKLWRWIFLIPTLLLGFIFIRRLLIGQPIVRPPDQHAANASEARAANMIRTKSLRPAAQELARDLVRQLADSTHDVSKWSINRRQVWVAPGVSGNAKRIREDVEKFAQLASGSDRIRRIKPRQLKKLATRIEELKFLHNTGQLRLQPNAATT